MVVVKVGLQWIFIWCECSQIDSSLQNETQWKSIVILWTSLYWHLIAYFIQFAHKHLQFAVSGTVSDQEWVCLCQLVPNGNQ